MSKENNKKKLSDEYKFAMEDVALAYRQRQLVLAERTAERQMKMKLVII